jgi:hypothetical protein
MKEIFEFRINYDYAGLLFKPNEGKNIDTSVKVVEITKDDPRYDKIPLIDKQVKERYDEGFYFGWDIRRKYGKKELETALLLHMKIKTTFEPSGEECGTIYDESVACDICGANRKQIGPLKLKKGSIPNRDIAITIAGEVVVSTRFVEACRNYGLKGLSFEPVVFENGPSNFYQVLTSSPALELTNKTIAGVDPFNLSESSEEVESIIISDYDIDFEIEVYKCPKGHTIGLNLLSELYVFTPPSIGKYDYFATKQKSGVKRGLLRPGPEYLCSSAFRKTVEAEKLKGFVFEVAHIE